jgi:hypothetical protein
MSQAIFFQKHVLHSLAVMSNNALRGQDVGLVCMFAKYLSLGSIKVVGIIRTSRLSLLLPGEDEPPFVSEAGDVLARRPKAD